MSGMPNAAGRKAGARTIDGGASRPRSARNAGMGGTGGSEARPLTMPDDRGPGRSVARGWAWGWAWACLAGSALALTAADVASASGTLTATGCSGFELISVQDPPLPPITVLHAVPAANPFAPVSFNDCVNAGGGLIKACVNAQSTWLDLGPGNLADGFVSDGLLTVAKPSAADVAQSKVTRTLTFSIGGINSFETFHLALNGTRTSALPTSQAWIACTLTASDGSTLFTHTGGAFTATSDLHPGTYTLTIEATASLAAGSVATSGSLDYTVEVASFVPACGYPGLGTCFLAHGEPSCNDLACCTSVCTIDPTCCSVGWDGGCADFAMAVCWTPLALGGAVFDPVRGVWYQPTSPSLWQTLHDYATGIGGRLLVLRDQDQATYVHRNVIVPQPIWFESAWIGLSDAANEGQFVWVDGTPLSPAVSAGRWAPGEPAGAGDYVRVDMVDDVWSTGGPTDIEGAIVELPAAGCGSGGSCFEERTSGGCDDVACCTSICGFDSYCCNSQWDSLCVLHADERCHAEVVAGPFINPANRHRYLVTQASSRYIAERAALERGGTLLVPDSNGENDWAFANLAAPNDLDGWIGISDVLTPGWYVTSFGPYPAIEDWAIGEPAGVGGRDFVVISGASGELATGTWFEREEGYPAYGFIELPCLGDLTDDGVVDAADLGILLGAWGSRAGDLNGDHVTDAADLSIQLGAWGPCPNSNACSPHITPGSDQPGCTACVCDLDPHCCELKWDAACVSLASLACNHACQCGD